MPTKGFIINLVDNLTLLTLVILFAYLLLKKCWTSKVMSFIFINVSYSILLFIVGYFYPLESPENEIISNLTMHIDTLSGFGFFYFLWEDERFRKFLKYSLIPVLLVWLISFAFTRDLKIHYWNLLLPSLWFFIASLYGMLLLYRNSGLHDAKSYISGFLLITGFLFYNFIYLVIETCYIFFTSLANITDAWSINYWSYFIFRILMLTGVISWYKQKRQSPVSALSTFRN